MGPHFPFSRTPSNIACWAWPSFRAFLQPDPGPAAVHGDELDAGRFEDRADPSEVTRPDQTLAALKEPYHPFGEANSIGHVHLRPSKQLACGLLLPRRDGRVIHRCWR